jgi:hypothetical protein
MYGFHSALLLQGPLLYVSSASLALGLCGNHMNIASLANVLLSLVPGVVYMSKTDLPETKPGSIPGSRHNNN